MRERLPEYELVNLVVIMIFDLLIFRPGFGKRHTVYSSLAAVIENRPQIMAAHNSVHILQY